MPLNSENPEADRDGQELRAALHRIRERYLALPLLDDRPADDIIGYDASGLLNLGR